MELPSTSTQPNADPIRHHLVLINSLDELTVLSDWVSELSRQLPLSSQGTFRLELVLTEAVTNVISYAYKDDEEHKIEVAIDYLDKTLTIELRDDGLPFDPLQRPEVEMPKSLEDATVGGLGIHLIRSYVDECRYQRDGMQNVLTLKIVDAD